MHRLFLFLILAELLTGVRAQERVMRYFPDGRDIVCLNGENRYTRALYGSPTLFRLETSDRPVFATYDKDRSRNISLKLVLPDGTSFPLDSTDYCESRFQGGLRSYVLRDHRWEAGSELRVSVMCAFNEEAVVWQFLSKGFPKGTRLCATSCRIAHTKMKRGGDLGIDPRGNFEADPQRRSLQTCQWDGDEESYLYYANPDTLQSVAKEAGRHCFQSIESERQRRMGLVEFTTPDPFVNTLGTVLMHAADGLWDGESWLHGCIGWRTQLAGWRAAYVGDVVGWGDRSRRHFENYAASMVIDVPPTRPHPTQDPDKGMARALKEWGTQMYSNGYICRSPNKTDVMHHYDMNLNYIDELLWHLQHDCDTAFIRAFWPKMKLHLEWEKRNFDPDGDHLFDAYCCIWASDALYYNSGAVTHSSAYNYRANRLAARLAEILNEDQEPYAREADQILRAMNSRLWMDEEGHWAEFQDFMGKKRLHRSAALWSIYTPIDCGACDGRQAFLATRYVDECLPHIPIDYAVDTAALSKLGLSGSLPDFQPRGYFTLSTTDWMPYVWSTNNVAHEEVANMALAYMLAGRKDMGFRLLKSDLLDEMYLGQSPGNFGQISYYDAARQEAYRDFGDNVGITARALINGLFGVRPQALDGLCVLQPAFPDSWDEASVRTPYLSYRFHREGGDDVYEVEQQFRTPLQIVVRQSLGGGEWTEAAGTAARRQTIRIHRGPKPDTGDSNIRYAGRQQMDDPQFMHSMGLDDITPDAQQRHRYVSLEGKYNSNVSDIFEQQYLTPRSPYTTLEIPVQGMGDWCVPGLKAKISDTGLRGAIGTDGLFDTGLGLRFSLPKSGHNVMFTSLWDNYPDSASVPLSGNASYAYLLMAGTTNNMQSRIDNGLVVVEYVDGSCDTLHLENPVNWCPIEQDYYYDDYAFRSAPLHPYRVHLGSGFTSRHLKAELNVEDDGSGVHTSDLTDASTPIAAGMGIPDGAAQILKMPLDSDKPLRLLRLVCLSNDVVIGLMGITLEE